MGAGQKSWMRERIKCDLTARLQPGALLGTLGSVTFLGLSGPGALRQPPVHTR